MAKILAILSERNIFLVCFRSLIILLKWLLNLWLFFKCLQELFAKLNQIITYFVLRYYFFLIWLFYYFQNLSKYFVCLNTWALQKVNFFLLRSVSQWMDSFLLDCIFGDQPIENFISMQINLLAYKLCMDWLRSVLLYSQILKKSLC